MILNCLPQTLVVTELTQRSNKKFRFQSGNINSHNFLAPLGLLEGIMLIIYNIYNIRKILNDLASSYYLKLRSTEKKKNNELPFELTIICRRFGSLGLT